MGKQIFKDPNGKDSVSIEECVLDKKIEDYSSRSALDKAIDVFLKEQSAHAPSALKAIKNALWEDTAHWEQLLFERAKVTAALALSPETQAALEKYRSK